MIKECLHYFQQPGFQRFMEAWIEKYQKLGHLGGSIIIKNLSEDEKNCLAPFLGLDLHEGKLKLSYRQLMDALNQTKFEGIDFLDVLKRFYKIPLYTNAQIKQMQREEYETFIQSIYAYSTQPEIIQWLDSYFENDMNVKKHYQNDSQYYKEVMSIIIQALQSLPCFKNHYALLAVFAQQISKDSHFLDEGLPRELLIKGIKHILNLDSEMSDDKILEAAGIYKDDLSNYCTVCHLKTNNGYLGLDSYEPTQITLYNLSHLHYHLESQPVLIIENPAVFRELAIYIEKEAINLALVCSYGQINLCTYTLLDMMHDHTLYYCGDYDPEGLMILDKLMSKYKITPYLYDLQYLERIQLSKQLSSKRMTICQHIQHHVLQILSQYIAKHQVVGYQEGLIQEYIKNISSIID